MAMIGLQIGDVVTGIEVIRTTRATDRFHVVGTFAGSLVPNQLKGGFSVWLENASAAQPVMGRLIMGTRRSCVTSRNIKKVTRAGVVVFSA